MLERGMQRKTIIKTIDAKLEDWVKTIDDPLLVCDIREGTILTGGAIASMLMGAKVNDYDIYFNTIELTERVARYYVNKFNEAKLIESNGTKNDHTPIVMRDKITNIKDIVEDRVVIYIQSAGVASEDMSAYQYFETRPDEVTEDFAESLVTKEDDTRPKYRPVFLSQNAITLSNDMQIVIRFHGKPAEIHDNYDFVHAMAYYDWSEGSLVIPPEAMESMMSKTLYYHGSLYPICSIFRAKKFIERGWHISAGQLLKIMWQISELNLKDYSVLKEQLTGVDAAYMHQLIAAIREVKDPAKLNALYISKIIDRIF